MGKVNMASHVAVFSIASLIYMFAYALGVTTTYFIGTSIGVENVPLARRYMVASIIVSVISLITVEIFLYSFAPQWAAVYTKDAEVYEMTIPLIRIYSFVLFFDGMTNILCSKMRVFGWQSLTAVLYLIQNFGLTFALTLYLAFWYHGGLGVRGIWMATLYGCMAGFAASVFILYRYLDIEKESEVIRLRKEKDREVLRIQDQENILSVPLL